jgi:hypothetical protein
LQCRRALHRDNRHRKLALLGVVKILMGLLLGLPI